MTAAPLPWRLAEVVSIFTETPSAKTIVLNVPNWPGHLAGQHVDVRRPAAEGHQAHRSYSVGSAPEEPNLALTVQRLNDGEVSPYLTEELRAGDQLELRGPIGGYFNWGVEDGGPLLLVAGGCGLVPLMAMLRHRAANASNIDTRLLHSARSAEDVVYRRELARLAGSKGLVLEQTFTREPPARWSGYARRVDAAMLSMVGPSPQRHPHVFVSGPSAFVERTFELLVDLGHNPSAIRKERFGPTGA